MSQFDDLKSRILYEIWLYAQNAGSHTTYAIDVIEEKILSPDCLSGMTRAAIASLKDEGYLGQSTETYVEFGGREYNQDEYYITESGIRSTEYDITHPGNLVYEIAHAVEPADVLDRASPSSEFVVPATDRMVTLRHNAAPYEAAIAALDEAVNAFKEDHLLENGWGSEKGALLRTIKAGRELLQESQVRVATALTTIVTPLRIISEKYQKAIAEGMAKAAGEQIVHLAEKAVAAVLSLLGLG